MQAEPEILLIAAVGRQGELGKNGRLLWPLPEDLQRFKELTTGHTVIMGRKTYESIGHPLPRRYNIVVTRQTDFDAPGVWIRHSPEEALALAQCFSRKIFIIGGESLYRHFMPLAHRLLLTEIDAEDPEADTYFPPIDPSLWQMDETSPHMRSTKGLPYRYMSWSRKKDGDIVY